VRITVDRDRCVGSAYCQRIAPDTFDLDDEGFAFVLDTGSADTGSAGTDTVAVKKAAAACPSVAISVLEA
jgi:ferredoxin